MAAAPRNSPGDFVGLIELRGTLGRERREGAAEQTLATLWPAGVGQVCNAPEAVPEFGPADGADRAAYVEPYGRANTMYAPAVLREGLGRCKSKPSAVRARVRDNRRGHVRAHIAVDGRVIENKNLATRGRQREGSCTMNWAHTAC